MWVEPDAVDWAALKHNYGSAEDVPGLLRRCAGPYPEDAESAADDLLNHLFHQGGWICSAASAALPYLLRLAATPDVPSRRTVLDLVSMLAFEAGQVAEKWVDPGWQPGWERALPEVLALLDAPEPEIRRAAADVIGACRSPGELTLPGWHRHCCNAGARCSRSMWRGICSAIWTPVERSALDAGEGDGRKTSVTVRRGMTEDHGRSPYLQGQWFCDISPPIDRKQAP